MSSTTSIDGQEAPHQELTRSRTRFGDPVFKGISTVSGWSILAILAAVAFFLVWLALPALTAPPSSTEGLTFKEKLQYGGDKNFWQYVLPYAFGTVWSSILAMMFAVPVAIGIALFISHYAPRKLAVGLGYIVDLLAAVPSVVFGLWGIQVFAPMTVPLYSWLNETFGHLPVLRWVFGADASATGRSILTAALVLAIMILPIITALTREVFLQTPTLHEEASLALGATQWEMIRQAVFPFGIAGIVSACMLGLGRALGETMAVAMVLSGSDHFSFQLLTSNSDITTNTIAASIAQNRAEAHDLGLNQLIASGLVLFVITLAVNMTARAILARRKEFSGAN